MHLILSAYRGKYSKQWILSGHGDQMRDFEEEEDAYHCREIRSTK